MISAHFRQATAALLAAVGLAASACEASSEAPRTFYIDFAGGSDQASGLSPTAAWKRAPGDPLAEGAPAKERLRPGDIVLFKGGVVYRGSIRFAASGAPDAPITFRGAGFGPGRAIVSGRDEYKVTLEPCAGAPACAGVDDASDLKVARLPFAVRPNEQIALTGQMLHLSQAPGLSDPFWFDDLERFQTIARADLQKGSAPDGWLVRHPFIAKTLGAAPVHDLGVQIWGMPNAVATMQGASYDAASSTVLAVGPDLQPYPDKDPKVALINHPRLIRQSLDYATVDGGRSVVVKAPGAADMAQFEISRRKVAFDAAGQSHLVIEDFEITGFAAGPQDHGQGSALLSSSKEATGLTFRRNDVHDLTSWAGAGAVHVSGTSGVVITDNRFSRMWRGGGVVMGSQAQDVRILRNQFDQISRTAVALFGVKRAWVDHNRISRLMGHHGNSIAAYLDNQDILISNNAIEQSTRGVTFHGGGGQPHRITIRNNLFWTVGDSGSGIQSWGDNTREVAIERNILLADGGRFALKLHASDNGLRVRQNIINGLALGGVPSPDWVFEGNTFTAENYVASPETNDRFSRRNAFAPGLQKAESAALAGKGAAAKLCQALGPPLASTEADFPWLTAEERSRLSRGVGPNDLCAS